MSIRRLKFINAFSLVSLVFFYILLERLPIGNGTTADISLKYLSLLHPATYVAYIVPFLYLLLTAFVFYQFSPIGSTINMEKVVILTGPYFATSSVLNIFWLISWHYEKTILSLFILLTLLFNLMHLAKRLQSFERTDNYHLFTKSVFDIYLGFVLSSVPLVFAAVLKSIDFNGYGISGSALACGAIIILTGVGILMSKESPFATISIMWVLGNILSYHIKTLMSGFPSIVTTLILALYILSLAIVFYRSIKMASINRESSDYYLFMGKFTGSMR